MTSFASNAIATSTSRPTASVVVGGWGNTLCVVGISMPDLDEVRPYSLDLEPTIAVKTSPGRYQALWRCNRSVSDELAKALVYNVGADKDSWARNKVLRIPGNDQLQA